MAVTAQVAGITGHLRAAKIKGRDLAGTVAQHPLNGQGYDFPVPLLPGDFVTVEQGTGFVHIAPGHGTDDYELGLKHGIEMPQTVGADGTYYPHVPLFAGKHVYWPNGKTGDANKAVIEAIRAAGGLLAEGKLVHSYPHSWRSNIPGAPRRRSSSATRRNGSSAWRRTSCGRRRSPPSPRRAGSRGRARTGCAR